MKYILLLIGVICCSTSIIFIKKSAIESEFLAAYRTLLAAILLIPICLLELKKHNDIQLLHYLKVSFWPGVLMALHFVTWMYGCRMAEPANSVLIANLTPLVMPIFLYLLINERLTSREIIGTSTVMIGIALLIWQDFNMSAIFFWGDLICFVSMIFFATYLIFGRKNKKLSSLWLYVTFVYAWCGILCFLFGISLFKNPIAHFDAYNLLQVFCLAFITTLLGHSFLNYAMKHIRGQIVGIINQFQFVFAAIYGYLIFDRTPSFYFYIASLFLILGTIIVIRKKTEPSNQTTS